MEARDGAPSARPNSGGQPNSVTKYIRIGIADKNDNPPYFDKHLYEAEVDENEDIQHTVLTVTANDKDESSRIRYEITRGNFGGAFAVKNMTGAIYVAGQLDYETRKRVSYNFPRKKSKIYRIFLLPISYLQEKLSKFTKNEFSRSARKTIELTFLPSH